MSRALPQSRVFFHTRQCLHICHFHALRHILINHHETMRDMMLGHAVTSAGLAVDLSRHAENDDINLMQQHPARGGGFLSNSL